MHPECKQEQPQVPTWRPNSLPARSSTGKPPSAAVAHHPAPLPAAAAAAAQGRRELEMVSALTVPGVAQHDGQRMTTCEQQLLAVVRHCCPGL